MDAVLSEGMAWVWGLLLIALTNAMHIGGVVMLALAGARIRARVEKRHLSRGHVISLVIGVFSVTGLLLSILHGVEAAVWAAAYLWLGAVSNPLDAMLYSVDSMASRGASALTLQPPWLMMGALEAAHGVLQFGISTAYMFAVILAYWPLLAPPTDIETQRLSTT